MNQKSPKIDFEKVERLVYHNLWNRRPYAPFFEWKNPEDPGLAKKVKERGVVCDLIRSLEKDAGRELFLNVRYGEDPPDSVADDLDGSLVGFEVTEFVDEKTLRASFQRAGKIKEWELNEVVEKIENVLNRKSKQLAASPHAKNILVMHTDEQDLRWKFRTGELGLDLHSFQKYPHIDKAYLLFSYQPGRETYPYFELRFVS